jgi:hypothetical protein
MIRGILILGFISLGFQLRSQHLQDVVYHLIGLNPKDTVNFPDANKRAIIEDFWTCIHELDKMDQRQRRLNGRAGFGFSGDQSGSQSLYKIDGMINGSRGIYPGELTFTSSIGMVLNNGKFSENVSNIYMAYNYHPQWGDSLSTENFIFLKRFTDAFLGVEQRYELGGGIILAKYSKNLTDRGKKLKKNLNKVEFSAENFDPDHGIWNLCSQYCARYNTDFVTEDDVKTIERVQKNGNFSLRKLFTKFRLGMLLGVFLETEKINTAFLTTSNGSVPLPVSFDPSQRVRWEFRPTLDVRPGDSWSFKVRPYFKMPMPWQWNQTVVGPNGAKSTLEDYRIDLESSMTIGLDDFIDTQNKNVDFIMMYNVYYDHAPARIFTTDTNTGVPILVSAPTRHSQFSFSFRVEF